MQNLSRGNFGLIIAYLLPGLTALSGIAIFSPMVRLWLVGPPMESPTVAGFLYVTLASLALGLVVNTIRWAIVDRVHHNTGLSHPQWDFAYLQANLAAFEGAVENHYRHYQFLGGIFIATAWTYGCFLVSGGVNAQNAWLLLAFLALEIVFWMGSRDALGKYHQRTAMLLREPGGTPIPLPKTSNDNDRAKNRLRKTLKLEGPLR